MYITPFRRSMRDFSECAENLSDPKKHILKAPFNLFAFIFKIIGGILGEKCGYLIREVIKQKTNAGELDTRFSAYTGIAAQEEVLRNMKI